MPHIPHTNWHIARNRRVAQQWIGHRPIAPVFPRFDIGAGRSWGDIDEARGAPTGEERGRRGRWPHPDADGLARGEIQPGTARLEEAIDQQHAAGGCNVVAARRGVRGQRVTGRERQGAGRNFG